MEYVCYCFINLCNINNVEFFLRILIILYEIGIMWYLFYIKWLEFLKEV